MYTTILVLMVIVAILLVLVIMIQNPKGGGLSSEFGGSSSQMFGVQRTGDILEQATWGFFTFIIVGALASGIFLEKKSGDSDNGLNVEKAVQTTRPAAVPTQTTPAPTAVPATTTPTTTQPKK